MTVPGERGGGRYPGADLRKIGITFISSKLNGRIYAHKYRGTDYEDGPPSLSTRKPLSDLVRDAVKSFVYEYDFGDEKSTKAMACVLSTSVSCVTFLLLSPR